MSGAGDSVLFTPEELAAMAAAAKEARREFDVWAAQLQTPAEKAKTATLAQEVRAMAAAFEADCAAGKYALSPSEFEQLRRGGIFVSHRKKGERRL